MRKTDTQQPAPCGRSLVASLQKGLGVVACFDRSHPKLTVSDVARLTATSPASARRSLLTLRELGYVAHDGKLFWLLPRVLLLGNAYLASRPLPTIVQPLLDALAERTRESASVAKLVDEHALIVARSTARRSLTVGLRIGSRLPAYCSATGRVLLASLDRGEAQARLATMKLEAVTPHTATTADAVLTHLDAARVSGWAISDGELEIGVRSMAVPVFNRRGETIAALSIAVRADRIGLDEMQRTYLPVLKRAQARLKEQLFED